MHRAHAQTPMPTRMTLPLGALDTQPTALGAIIPAPPPSNPIAYAVVGGIGATLGGALVGFIAGGTPASAVTGGLFTSGLAGVADAAVLHRGGHKWLAAASGAWGLISLGLALTQFSGRTPIRFFK